MTLSVGADGFDQFLYDPACTGDAWSRGFGPERTAKLLARSILTSLGMPVEDWYYFAPMSHDGWYGGAGDVVIGALVGYEPCWRSDSDYALFDRVPGTGILEVMVEGEPYDVELGDPTVYAPDAAGLALLAIARQVSASSPHEASVSGAPSAQDRYSVTALETADGFYVALWFTNPDRHALSFMDWLSGYADTGSTERRVHAVEIAGIGGVTGATRIALDGSPDRALPVSVDVCGNAVVPSVVFGELPVLLRLEGAPVPNGSSACGRPAWEATGSCPGQVEFAASGLTPGGEYRWLAGAAVGSDPVPVGKCAGVATGLTGPLPHGNGWADRSGAASVTHALPPAVCGHAVQILDVETCTLSTAAPIGL